MDIGADIEKAGEAAKKNWWVFLLAALILIAWVLSQDIKQPGSWSLKASKWPIIGPYFFKGTSLAPGTNASAPAA